jgi:hypothetical protein
MSYSTQTAKKGQPWWLVLCWSIAGLGVGWGSAVEWFANRYSAYSEPVIRRAGLISVCCALFALVSVCAARRAKLRDAGAVFFFASLLAYIVLYKSEWWIGHR